MTAALESVRLSVGQLSNITDLNTQERDVALSVTRCANTANLRDCQALEGSYALLAQQNYNAVANEPAAISSPLCSGAIGGIVAAGDAGADDNASNTATSSGPSTPEQADTVGVQLDDDEKPSSPSCELSQQRPLDHSAGIDNGALTDAAKGAAGERFTCSGATAGDANRSRLGESQQQQLDPATTAHPATTPASLDQTACPATGIASSIAAASGTVPGAPREPVAQGPSAVLAPLNSAAERHPAAGLSVRTAPAVDCAAAAAAGLLSADVEPVTPTTPQRQPPSAPLLPPATDPQRMTLVLDLDGTLIASEDEPHAPVPFDYCVDEERFVWLRPGLRRFLDSVRPHFEVVLFTAAGESWATSALQRIDPEGTIFDSRLYRDHTVSHDDWPWVKDLSRLGRDLARVVIVDDNPLMFMYQPDNALHVAAFDPQLTGHNDDVLEQVLDVLMHKVLIAEDVREVLRSLKDPITAACMAARHAAAKAAAVSVTSASSSAAPRAGTAQSAQARKSSGPAATTAVTPASAPGRVASDPAASQGAPGAVPTVAPAKASRRARRASKQQQQQQQQQQQEGKLPGPLASQGLLGPIPQGAASAEKAVEAPTSAGALKPQPEKRQRRPRSRRRGGGGAGANGGDAGVDGAAGPSAALAPARASAGHPAAAATALAAAAQRPPVVVTRVRGPKHPLKGAAAQLAGPSLLQQPEQQLQLKLKLLQLQREQEEEEEKAGEGVQEGEEDGVVDAAGQHKGVSCDFQGPCVSGATEATGAADGTGAPAARPAGSTGARQEAPPAASACAMPPEPVLLIPAASSAAGLTHERPGLSTAALEQQVQVCSGPAAVASQSCAAKGAAVPPPNGGEQKARSRRRGRRRPLGAAAQGEASQAPGARVAGKSSAADASLVGLIDGGNDVLAVAARRVLQDRG